MKTLAARRTDDYARRMRRYRRLLPRLVATVLVVAFAVPALGSPADVIADFDADGRIDGTYGIGDLRNAPLLQARLQPSSVPALEVAVDEKIAEILLGQPPSKEPTTTPAPELPEVAMPWWAILGAAGAGVLVVAGIASSVALRTRRRHLRRANGSEIT